MTDSVQSSVTSVVFEALEEFGADKERIGVDATLETLDIDSLDVVELCQIVSDTFGVEITADQLVGIKTVGDAIAKLEPLVEDASTST